MAALEKQLALISDLLNDALARTIRLVQYRTGAKTQPDSIDQLKREIATGNSQNLALLLSGSPINGLTPTLEERWIAESLSAAGVALANITPRVVRAFRRQGKSTVPVFESYIAAAQEDFSKVYGVRYSINACFSEPQRYQTDRVEELAKLAAVARTLERRFKILASRILSFAYSPQLWVALLVLLLISIPVGYYIDVAHQTRITDAAKLQKQVALTFSKQTSEIVAIVKQPETDLWTKASETSKKVKDIVGNAKAIIAGLVAIWGLVIKRLGR